MAGTPSEEAISLQQTRRTYEFIRIPPERRTRGRAAGTQNALVQPVELFTLFGGLQPFLGRWRRIVLQKRINLFVLAIELGHINHQIAYYRQTRQRPQDQLASFGNFRDGCYARQSIFTVHVDTVRTADPFPAGASIGERRIRYFQEFQHIQHHQVFTFG